MEVLRGPAGGPRDCNEILDIKIENAPGDILPLLSFHYTKIILQGNTSIDWTDKQQKGQLI